MTDDRNVSYILKSLLDNLGLDEEQRQRRMTCQKMKQLLESILPKRHYVTMLSGSSFEATTIDGLSSDCDIMHIFNENCDCLRVIADIADWREGEKSTLFMDSTGCSRGFVKLYVLSHTYPGPVFADMYRSSAPYEVDNDGRVLLSNKKSSEPYLHFAQPLEFHGPAVTLSATDKRLETDYVFTLRINSFPNEASWWKQRQTPLTRTRIDPAIIDGINHCYLVPVGNKTSLTEHLEWRLSFSHIENQLIHAWKNVQYQCYVLMKFIQKDLIKPFVPDVLCSYHFKTLVMWMNEEYSGEFFNSLRIEQCALMCLKHLAASVRKRSLPHYFIDGCNLFSPKLTNNNEVTEKLVDVIENIVETWPASLFAISRCDLGRMLRCNLKSYPSVSSICSGCISHIHKKRRTVGYWFELLQELRNVSVCFYSLKDRVYTFHETINVYRVLSDLCNLTKHSICNDECRQFLNFAIRDILCNVGLEQIQCNISVSNKTSLRNITSGLRYIQRYRNSCCIDTGLKIAAHFVVKGNYRQSSTFLDRVENQIKSYTAFECSHSFGQHVFVDKIHRETTYDNQPSMTEFCKHYHGFAIEYRHQQIARVPKGLAYEMFRSTSVSPLSDPSVLYWHSEAVIHCPVYLYYLRFLCHQAQGRNAHRQVALENMEWAAKEVSVFPRTHLETNHNIIGHCHRSSGNTRRAYKEYRKSLEIEKYNNAVLWHLAVLLRNQIRGEH